MRDLTIEELETMLCSTGYLPPRNEDELDFFNKMYMGYMSRLENKYVDIESIVNGSCCLPSKFYIDDESDSHSSMAADEFDLQQSKTNPVFERILQ